jgi:hypothetical protein
MSVRGEPETFFCDGIMKLADSCKKCAEVQGGYFGK